MRKTVRVLIVDDSKVVRGLLSQVLSSDPDIEVVGAAADPYEARDMIKTLDPDVITLDVEMPRMDGVTFLRKIMTLRPMPVVMLSTLTAAGAQTTLEALEIGAVDFVAKPTEGFAARLPELAFEICEKVKIGAGARVQRSRPEPSVTNKSLRHIGGMGGLGNIIAIGASTGGVEALKVLLCELPAAFPPILITQHMPPRFTTAFAERLDRECALTVKEAKHDDPIEANHVYIAPGGFHLELAKKNGRLFCSIHKEPPVSGHRPSVDVLFRSVGRNCGAAAIGVILTGMGRDGAAGLREMRQHGAITLGQDQASSLIYGMPRVAFEIGAVQRQIPLLEMANALVDSCGLQVQMVG